MCVIDTQCVLWCMGAYRYYSVHRPPLLWPLVINKILSITIYYNVDADTQMGESILSTVKDSPQSVFSGAGIEIDCGIFP